MKIPEHIAIIPDGNRRWAQEHNLQASSGHTKGVDAVKGILETSLKLRIPYLSLWGSSLSNLTMRPRREVRFLEALYETNFKELLRDKNVHENQVKVRVLGEWESVLGKGARNAIESAINATAGYDRFSLTFLIAYDGKVEMLKAIEKVAGKICVNRDLRVTEAVLKENLYSSDMPPVDLLIRTGGEPHLSSGFMMWDMSEAQLIFSNKYWPEFTGDDLYAAVKEFQDRRRKFGK